MAPGARRPPATRTDLAALAAVAGSGGSAGTGTGTGTTTGTGTSAGTGTGDGNGDRLGQRREPPPTMTQRHRLLLVDDDAQLTQFLGARLRRDGFDVADRRLRARRPWPRSTRPGRISSCST